MAKKKEVVEEALKVYTDATQVTDPYLLAIEERRAKQLKHTGEHEAISVEEATDSKVVE